ncbi:Eukaryotic translation initiation factor 3 subunit G [Apiospora arundinis]
MSIPNDAACMAKKDELDAFLTSAFQGNKTSAAYLVAPVESGQSTYLLGHVASMARHHDAGPVVYVAEHHAEATDLFARYRNADNPPWRPDNVEALLKHDEEFDDDKTKFSTGQLVFCAYDTIPWGAMPKRCVVVAAVAVCCTTAAEMFFAKLLGLCSNSANKCMVLCHAARLSTRTTDGLRRNLPPGTTISVIDVPDTREPLVPEEIAPADFVKAAQQALRECETAAVALAGRADPLEGELLPPGPCGSYEVDFPQLLQDSGTVTLGEFRKDGARMRVEPGLGFVASCPSLGLLVSRRQRTMEMYNGSTSLLVEQTRELAPHERRIRYLVRGPELLRHQTGKRWSGDVDPQGPAYHRDLLETLLRLAEHWDGLHVKRWPMRPVPDPNMAAEGFRRLGMMDCTRQPKEGVIEVTDRGAATLQALDAIRDSYSREAPRFETCCLLAVARELTSLPAKRVVVLMALLVGVPPVVQVRDGGALAKFRDAYTTGAGWDHFYRGWLWMALGFWLWECGRILPGGLSDDKGWTELHGVVVLFQTARWVKDMFGDLAEGFDDDEDDDGNPHPLAGLCCDDLVAGTALTKPELREVEWALMQALHTQCVMVENQPPPNAPPGIDLLTMRRATIDRPLETVLQDTQADRDDEPGGFSALYREVQLPKNHGEPLAVSQLTYIPRELCLLFGRESNQEFPWCCETVYPLTH